MLSRLFLLLAIAASFTLSGCATPDQEASSIPWNRPEKWEGQGPIGSMMNTN